MGKKNLIKKSLVYALTGSMLLSNITPALAYTYKDSEPSFTVQDVNDNKTSNTTVYAEVGSFFKVTIPKHIILNGTTKSGAYTVSIEGDIAGTEVVNVVPDESFALKSNNLKDVTASIAQDKTSWGYAEILEGSAVIGNGAIDAKDITAGSWNGNFNFNINLEDKKDGSSEDTEILPTVTLSETDIKMGANGSMQVNAYIDGENVNDFVTWTSDNENVIVTNGLVETKILAHAGETATITVSAPSVSLFTLEENEQQEIILAQFKVTVIDMAYTATDANETIESINLKPGETKNIEVAIIPDSINEIVNWNAELPEEITLSKNGNTVAITANDNAEAGKSYDLIASYGKFSKTLKINIIESHKHSYTSKITTPATCETKGVLTYTCSCTASYIEEIPITGHTYKNDYCIYCNEKLEPGLYDTNGNLLCTWEESNILIGDAYLDTNSPHHLCYVTTKIYPTAIKVIFPDDITSLPFGTFSGTSLYAISIPRSMTYASVTGINTMKEVIYAGTTYTSKSQLRAALITNGVELSDGAFNSTGLNQ